MPSLSALLPYSAWEMVGHDSPFLWSINIDQMQQQPVFNIHPWTLHQGWIQHLLPSMQTLYVSSALEVFCNPLPVLTSIYFHCLSKLFVFYLSPMTFHFCIVAGRALLLLIFGRASFVQMWILHLMSDQVLLSLSVIVQISYSSCQHGFGLLLLQIFSSAFHVFVMVLEISWDTIVSSISTMLTISKLLRIVLVLLLAAIIWHCGVICLDLWHHDLPFTLEIPERRILLALADLFGIVVLLLSSSLQLELCFLYLYLSDLVEDVCFINSRGTLLVIQTGVSFVRVLLLELETSLIVLTWSRWISYFATAWGSRSWHAAQDVAVFVHLPQLVMITTVVNQIIRLIVLAILPGFGRPFQVLSARAVPLTSLLGAQALILVCKSVGVVPDVLAVFILAIEALLFALFVWFEFGRDSWCGHVVLEATGELVEFHVRTGRSQDGILCVLWLPEVATAHEAAATFNIILQNGHEIHWWGQIRLVLAKSPRACKLSLLLIVRGIR